MKSANSSSKVWEHDLDQNNTIANRGGVETRDPTGVRLIWIPGDLCPDSGIPFHFLSEVSLILQNLKLVLRLTFSIYSHISIKFRLFMDSILNNSFFVLLSAREWLCHVVRYIKSNAYPWYSLRQFPAILIHLVAVTPFSSLVSLNHLDFKLLNQTCAYHCCYIGFWKKSGDTISCHLHFQSGETCPYPHPVTPKPLALTTFPTKTGLCSFGPCWGVRLLPIAGQILAPPCPHLPYLCPYICRALDVIPLQVPWFSPANHSL